MVFVVEFLGCKMEQVKNKRIKKALQYIFKNTEEINNLKKASELFNVKEKTLIKTLKKLKSPPNKPTVTRRLASNGSLNHWYLYLLHLENKNHFETL